jgi:AraC-like DNA-binding protein
VLIYPQATRMPSAARRPRPATPFVPPEETPSLPIMLRFGNGAPDARFICGYLGCDARPFNPLLSALPRMLRVPAKDGGDPVGEFMRIAAAETQAARWGSGAIRARMAEMLFVAAVRRHLDTLPEGATGWLGGLRDPHVGRALGLLHARPAQDWTLEALAREVGLSRTVLHERFAALVASRRCTTWHSGACRWRRRAWRAGARRSPPSRSRWATSRRPPSTGPSSAWSASRPRHGGANGACAHRADAASGGQAPTNSPPRISGSTAPSCVTPSTSIAPEPIIQSMWMREALAPRFASSSIARPAVAQAGGVGLPEGDVARRVLVEQRVAEQQPRGRDGRGVRHQRDLAEPRRALIRREHLAQHLGAAGGIGLDDAPALEAHGDVLDQRAL